MLCGTWPSRRTRKIVTAGLAYVKQTKVSTDYNVAVARFLGDSGTAVAAASVPASVSRAPNVIGDTAMIVPIAPSTDDVLTRFAMEWMLSTPKSGRPNLRSSSHRRTL